MMENETRPGQSDGPPHDPTSEGAAERRKRHSSRKTLLVAVIVSVMTIGALVILRGGQVDGPRDDASASDHTLSAFDDDAVNAGGAVIEGTPADGASPLTGGISEAIARSIDALSARIDQWFESSATEHASVNHALSELTGGMGAMQESIAELHKGNDEIRQRIADAQSRLDGIAQDVRAIKAATQKQAATRQKQATSVPPFHVDAIDLWGDAAYVAVSQDGRVAFLREGERRSGWQVTHIDRTKGEVVFRGPEGQDYSASMGR